jgi:hypothetical protein
MERITDAWDSLGRREKILAVVALGVLVVVILMFVLFGGGEPTGVDADAAASDAALQQQQQQPPGTVAANPGTTEGDAPSTPQGVAAISSSGGGGGDPLPEGFVPDNAGVTYPDEHIDDRRYHEPVVSDAVKNAGRDLERVAHEYMDCIVKAHENHTDNRPCLQLSFGVFTKTTPHNRGGMTFVKMSSDGHELEYTIMPPPGEDCRSMDNGESCDAWVAG